MTFPYSTHHTFLRCPELGVTGDAPFVLCGVPTDVAVTNRPGARFGPASIRRASAMLCDATHPWFGVSPAASLRDAGDLILPNTSLSLMRTELQEHAQALMAQHHCVWLGGDHSVTLSLLRALFAVRQVPVAVLHFDAHCDTWPDHNSEPSGHGTWVSEAVQEGLIDPQHVVQIGLRSAAEAPYRDYIEDRGGLAIHARELRGLSNAEQLAGVLRAVRERLGELPVYLTLDIDCLDPAFAPGTGTPEPGGLHTDQVLTLLEELVPQCNFVGMDCVEVAPPFDHAEITSLAAAHFVWTYLAAMVVKHEGGEVGG